MDSINFNIDNHTISYDVNWLGIETIKVNGNEISKKVSLPKRKHKFELNVFGNTEAFYITSKQSFSSGQIIVQLFHNDTLIDEKVLKFNFPVSNTEVKHPENSTFMTGLIFIVFSLLFGWSKFFLFIGLICVFSSFFSDNNSACTEDSNSDVSN